MSGGQCGAGAMRSCSRRSGAGAHQLYFPRRPISAGTSSERTTNASTRTPNAVAMPICWMNEIELVLKAPMATARRIAAAVTSAPLQPHGHRLALAQPAVPRLLDPAEEEDAVVGG